MEQCHGRWRIEYDENIKVWDNKFYNGRLLKVKNSTDLCLFIPNKMVNKSGEIQNYNNKFAKTIVDIIALNFDASAYKVQRMAEGTKQNSHEVKHGVLLPFFIRMKSNPRSEARFVATPIKRQTLTVAQLICDSTFTEKNVVNAAHFCIRQTLQTLLHRRLRSLHVLIMDVKWMVYLYI